MYILIGGIGSYPKFEVSKRLEMEMKGRRSKWVCYCGPRKPANGQKGLDL